MRSNEKAPNFIIGRRLIGILGTRSDTIFPLFDAAALAFDGKKSNFRWRKNRKNSFVIDSNSVKNYKLG